MPRISGATGPCEEFGRSIAIILQSGRPKTSHPVARNCPLPRQELVDRQLIALTRLVQNGNIKNHPLHSRCAAISVGIVGGIPALDLPYIEDSTAEVDMNVVMNSGGAFVEVQGTAEGAPFDRAELDSLLNLALAGTSKLAAIQTASLQD